MNELIDRWWMNEWIDDRWVVDGWMDGWMREWMNEWGCSSQQSQLGGHGNRD